MSAHPMLVVDHPQVCGATSGAGRLVDIISGSFGAGHDAAAGAIAHRLKRQGFRTRIFDIVELLPGPSGRALRAAYLRQMQTAPSSWGWLLTCLQHRALLASLISSAVGASGTALLGLAADSPSLVVSTHPFASQALGHLRATRRLRVPVVTYLTDMSVHRLWVNTAVDAHLAMHAIPADQARTLGARNVRVVSPAVADTYATAPRNKAAKAGARRIMGLPAEALLVLVTGGSEGIGGLERAAAAVAATGVGVPVVLCGHNERLRRLVESFPWAIALGWVDDMAMLLCAVDVVVQNAGGITTLEALATGLPVVSYRCLPGHGETNAAALDRSGLVPWVRAGDDLRSALATILRSGRTPHGVAGGSLFDAADVADALADEARVTG